MVLSQCIQWKCDVGILVFYVILFNLNKFRTHNKVRFFYYRFVLFFLFLTKIKLTIAAAHDMKEYPNMNNSFKNRVYAEESEAQSIQLGF